MRFAATFAVALLSGSLAFAQGQKDPFVQARRRSGVAAPNPVSSPAGNSSATALSKIEHSTATLRSPRPVALHNTAAPPAAHALDLGKNKKIRAASSHQSAQVRKH